MPVGTPIWLRWREPAIQAALLNGALVLVVPVAGYIAVYVVGTALVGLLLGVILAATARLVLGINGRHRATEQSFPS